MQTKHLFSEAKDAFIFCWNISYVAVQLLMLTFNSNTSTEGIASVSRRTRAGCIMIYHLTASVGATSTRTWIGAFLIMTGEILSAIRANDALWSTIGWRSNKVGITRTNCVIIDNTTLTVGSTGRRYTRINIFWCYRQWTITLAELNLWRELAKLRAESKFLLQTTFLRI